MIRMKYSILIIRVTRNEQLDVNITYNSSKWNNKINIVYIYMTKINLKCNYSIP